jgi:hypothetical protein
LLNNITSINSIEKRKIIINNMNLKQSIAIVTSIIAIIAAVPIINALYTDTGDYIEFNGNKYIKIGTGDLGNKKSYGLFNKPQLLENWINSAKPNLLNVDDNLSNKLTVIDLIQGVTEGNVVFNKNTNKWILTENFVTHIEPIASGRTKDNLGSINTGLISAACYINRPTDTELNPLCDQAFKSIGLNEDSFGALPYSDKKINIHKTKLPLLLTNFKSNQIKQDAKKLMETVNNEGMANQKSTIKLYYIDQINQLGIQGAESLVKIDSGYKELSKAKLLAMFRNIGVIDSNNIFRIAWGDTFDFKTLPREALRLLFSRLMYYNAEGDLNNFKGRNIDWIERGAKQSTFKTLENGDYPDIYNEIKELVRQSKGEQNWGTMLVEGIQGPDNSITVNAYTTDRQPLLSKNYPIKTTGFVYTPQNFLTGDAFRRYSVFPQTNTEFNNMQSDANRMILELEGLFK